MKAEYFIPGLWKDINLELSAMLNIETANCELRVYRGLYPAVSEISNLLFEAYPHRQKSIFFKKQSPVFEDLLFEYKKSAKELEEFELEILTENEEAFVSHLKKSLIVFTTNQWPLLGKKINTSLLTSFFEKARCYNLNIEQGFEDFESISKKMSKFQVIFVPVSPGYTIALLGARAKLGEGTTSKTYWDNGDLESIKSHLEERNSFTSDKDKVLSLEASGIAGSKAFFDKSEDRDFDRAVLCWEDMDSSAIQELVAEKLSHKTQPPGLESDLECLSPSRWKGYGSLDWLENFGIKPEESRGMLIVSSKMITENFISALEASREEILKLQSGAHG